MPVIVVGLVSVPVAGTPLRLTDAPAYQALPTQHRFGTAQAVYFQAWKDNTGEVYIGGSSLDGGTGADLAQVLVAPTAGAQPPSWGVGHQLSPAGVSLADLYLDVEQGGDAVLVSLLVT